MDTQHFIAYGIFFLLFGLELGFSFHRHLKLYKTDDTINNLVLGILTTLFNHPGWRYERGFAKL